MLTLPRVKRIEILQSIDPKKAAELGELISYSKTSIGKLINPHYISVGSELSSQQALSSVKEQLGSSKFSTYIYTVNNENHLVGAFKISDLLVRANDEQVFKFMEQDVIVAHLTTPREIALKRMLKYKLYALPVVGDNKKMIGVVTFDDLAEELVGKL